MTAAIHTVAPEEVMAFLDGELTAAEAEAVSAHIAACEECAALAVSFRSTSEALAQWEVPPIPEGLAGTLLDARIGGKARRSRSFPVSKPWMWSGAALAVASLVAVFLGVSRPAYRRYVKLAEPVAQQATMVAGLSSGKTDRYRGILEHAAIPAPMIARTAGLTIQVKSVDASRSLLDAVLARHQGYAAKMDVSTAEFYPHSMTASLRIPAADLAAALADLKSMGRTLDESQSGEEVSQEHADLEARLKTARATEERFRAILQQRTGSVADVMEVEEGIARVRGDIERMDAEQKNLEHRVDFASVELTLNEEYKASLNAPGDSVGTQMHNALITGYRNASGTLLGIVLFFAEYGLAILIWLVILGVPAVLIRRRYRRMRSRF